MALNSMASTMSESSAVFASDEDPELIRDAVPFALKTMEALLVDLPENQDLLLSACQGFTQYAFAFVQVDAERLDDVDWRRAEELRTRARQLYLRGRDYGFRGLEVITAPPPS